MNRPGFRSWCRSDEQRAAAEEAVEREEQSRRDRVARAAAERDALNREAMLAAARLLIAEVVALHPGPVTAERIAARLGIDASTGFGQAAARGVSLLLGVESDEQRSAGDDAPGGAGMAPTLREAQSVGDRFLGLRYRRADGRPAHDARSPSDPRRPYFARGGRTFADFLADVRARGDLRDAGRGEWDDDDAAERVRGGL